MKKSFFRFLCLICAVCCASKLMSQEAGISSDTAKSVNEDIKAYVPEVTSSTLMEQAFEEFRKERDITAFGAANAKGVMYVTGHASVTANVNSPNFVKARTMAYEKAYVNAIASVVMDLYGKEMVSTVSRYFSDESDDTLQPPQKCQDIQDNISRKIDGLTEAKLDEGLRQMGKNPADYENNVQAKRTVFKSEIVNKSIRRAIGKASGYLPVQTFETRSEDGTYSIGVVLRVDPDTTEIAKSLYSKRVPLVGSNSGISVDEALPGDQEMMNQFGVRVFFDQQGRPALLSFGSWGSSYTGNNVRRRERAMEHAFTQAEAMANEQLTKFINSSISMVQESERSEDESESVVFDSMDNATEENVTKYIDRVLKETKMEGSDSMIGRSTVKKVTLVHPSGHKIACVVRLWSFDTLESAKNIIKGKRPEPPKSRQAAPINKEDSGIRKGRVYDF